jgi:hypothetical protein
MKFKTTQREIKANFSKIICVPYCELQYLLNFKSPIAYTVRREGWAADIYDMGCGVAIVTGYAPFGKIFPSYELREKYEKEARKISYNCSYEEGRKALQELQKNFIEEVLKND